MTQPLSNIVQLTVEVSPTPATPNTFNIGLIVGPSTVIPVTTRTVEYANTAAMLTGGWQATDPEYLAAEVYFEQTPTPTKVVIGRQGNVTTELTSALASGTAYTSLSVQALTEDIPAGTPITIGTGTSTQTATTSADSPVGSTTIAVTSFTANAAYAAGTLVTAQAETLLEAVTACRAANYDWYGVYVLGTADADIEAIAPYIETAVPASAFFYDTSDSAVTAGTAGNVMATLQTAKYSRTLGIWSTSQYAGAGVMGEAMGLNTGLANSAYTLAYKSLVGVTPEVFTGNQPATVLGYNGNIYTNYGSTYNLLVQGTMADGTPFDQKLNVDQIVADLQTAVMDALTANPKIPQTDPGVTQLVNALSAACEEAKTRGAIAPGVWNGGQVLGLQNGTALPNGYMILADTLANQSQADRTARKSPPIYVCLKMAGAIEHAIIGVIVNQ